MASPKHAPTVTLATETSRPHTSAIACIQGVVDDADLFRCAGAVCVRGTKEEVGVIDDTVKKCQEGGTLLLFPEGTREQENKFLPLKSGLFVSAAETVSAGVKKPKLPYSSSGCASGKSNTAYNRPLARSVVASKIRSSAGESIRAARPHRSRNCSPTSGARSTESGFRIRRILLAPSWMWMTRKLRKCPVSMPSSSSW